MGRKERERDLVAARGVFCHKSKSRMTASGIMFTNYLTHNEVLHTFCLRREEVRKLLLRESLSLYITYNICHFP